MTIPLPAPLRGLVTGVAAGPPAGKRAPILALLPRPLSPFLDRLKLALVPRARGVGDAASRGGVLSLPGEATDEVGVDEVLLEDGDGDVPAADHHEVVGASALDADDASRDDVGRGVIGLTGLVGLVLELELLELGEAGGGRGGCGRLPGAEAAQLVLEVDATQFGAHDADIKLRLLLDTIDGMLFAEKLGASVGPRLLP